MSDKGAKGPASARNFFGTWNNPVRTLDELISILRNTPGVIAARAQLEKGKSGTPHFQFCFFFNKVVRLKSMQLKFKGAHIEITRNAFQAWEYCGKEEGRIEGPVEFGVPPAARNVKGDTAKRNKLILEMGVVKACEEGLVPLEKFKQVKQSLDLFQVMKKESKPNDTLDNEWHYGPTGTGKSRSVRTKYPEAFIKSNDLWWDGYAGEEVVIIEEMGPKQINGHHIKIWADHYQFKAAQKGSQLLIRPKKIIVTSNYSIRECYEAP